MSSWTHERAVLANATQRGDAEKAAKAGTRMKAARAEDYIRTLVDEAPELTQEQRSKLALILRGGSA